MDYVRQKAKLMARMKMSGGNKPSVKIQVNGRRNLGRLHASLLSAGDKGDSEAGEEDREERHGERQDRLDQGPQEEEQDDAECSGGEAA